MLEDIDYIHHGTSLNFVEMVAIATPKAVKLEPAEGAIANLADAVPTTNANEAGANPDDPTAVAERCAMVHSSMLQVQMGGASPRTTSRT
eukprot:14238675-Heterocapsa_arctica.AAC.1